MGVAHDLMLICSCNLNESVGERNYVHDVDANIHTRVEFSHISAAACLYSPIVCSWVLTTTCTESTWYIRNTPFRCYVSLASVELLTFVQLGVNLFVCCRQEEMDNKWRPYDPYAETYVPPRVFYPQTHTQVMMAGLRGHGTRRFVTKVFQVSIYIVLHSWHCWIVVVINSLVILSSMSKLY